MTDRLFSGDALQFQLREEIARTMDREILSRSGRNARTLLKEGMLRVTVITLDAGGAIPSHHAPGPLMVHVLKGKMEFSFGTKTYTLEEGELLAVPAAFEHSVRSEGGASFLLIIVHPG
jgi:quercetin dioxygenase-like cupin family protein